MNIMNQLKDAIEKRSWVEICNIYKFMTGQNIKCPDMDDGFSDKEVLKVMLTNALSLLSGNKTKTMDHNNDLVSGVGVSNNPVNLESVVVSGDEDDTGMVSPSDLLTKKVSKQNVFGGTPELVTTAINQEELEKNQKKSIEAMSRKTPRPAPVTHKVECSGCGKVFDSPFPATNDIGMSCTKCIIAARPIR